MQPVRGPIFQRAYRNARATMPATVTRRQPWHTRGLGRRCFTRLMARACRPKRPRWPRCSIRSANARELRFKLEIRNSKSERGKAQNGTDVDRRRRIAKRSHGRWQLQAPNPKFEIRNGERRPELTARPAANCETKPGGGRGEFVAGSNKNLRLRQNREWEPRP